MLQFIIRQNTSQPLLDRKYSITMATSFSSDNRSDELPSLQRQIQEKRTGILESVRRMGGLVYESEAVGTNTAAVSLHSLSCREGGERVR